MVYPVLIMGIDNIHFLTQPDAEPQERRRVKYRLKSLLTEATQWFQPGDHSQVQDIPEPSLEEPEEELGNPYCSICGNLMTRHGFLDGVNGEEIICPSDYIAEDRQGLPYRLSRGEFESQYEPYVRPPGFPPIPSSDLEERRHRRQTREAP